MPASTRREDGKKWKSANKNHFYKTVEEGGSPPLCEPCHVWIWPYCTPFCLNLSKGSVCNDEQQPFKNNAEVKKTTLVRNLIWWCILEKLQMVYAMIIIKECENVIQSYNSIARGISYLSFGLKLQRTLARIVQRSKSHPHRKRHIPLWLKQ